MPVKMLYGAEARRVIDYHFGEGANPDQHVIGISVCKNRKDAVHSERLDAFGSTIKSKMISIDASEAFTTVGVCQVCGWVEGSSYCVSESGTLHNGWKFVEDAK